VDCADRELCLPTDGPSAGKDYSDWASHSANRMSERCRNDFDRYGVCAVLFELTSYDDDFGTGLPDERAMRAFNATLDELKAMGQQEGAVFMTVGEYAASQRALDAVAPSITIASPTDRTYGPTQSATVDVDVTDEVSGVHEVAITLDGAPVADGSELPLATLAGGTHVLAVRAEDSAGNVAQDSVTFTVDATAPAITIASPTARTYGPHESLRIDATATDAGAGVRSVDITLDGAAALQGQVLDLSTLPLGRHVLAVRAVDGVGNASERSVAFTVNPTLTSLRAMVQRAAADGTITDARLVKSLLGKLDAAIAAQEGGRTNSALTHLRGFTSEVSSQRGKKIPTATADRLLADAEVVRAALAAPR
jgi:hypothetical protein